MKNWLAFAAAVGLAGTATAQTWTATASGNWSTGANWSTGIPPAGGTSTNLTFGGIGGYTATNDLGPFVLRSLTLDNRGTDDITVAYSNTSILLFAGTSPSIFVSGSGPSTLSGGTISIPNALTVTTPASATAVGTLTISGLLSGSGTLAIDRLQGGFLGATVLDPSPTGSFTGNVSWSGGPLALGSATALGPGNLIVGTNGTGFDAAGDLRATTVLTLPNLVTINSGRTLTVVAGSALTLAGTTTGQGGLNLGDGLTPSTPTLTLTGVADYLGPTRVVGGTLALAGNGTNGALSQSALTVGRNGTVVLGSATTFNPNRVAGTVTLEGGNLTLVGNSTAGNDLTQSIPTVATRGFVTLTADAQTATATRLAVGNLQRFDRATLRVRGEALGSAAFGTAGVANIAVTQIDGQPVATRLVGGGGAAGTPTRSIIPFLIGASSAGGGGDGFVTADANGLRPLNATTEYAAQLVPLRYADPATNYRLTLPAAAVNVPTTVNALAFPTAGAGVYGASGPAAALTVTSGAVFSFADVHTGPLAFGSAEGVVHVITNTLNVGAITGSNGLTVGGTGEVVLTNTTGLTGPVTVNGGTVIPGLSTALPATVALNGGGIGVRGFEDTLTTNLAVGPGGGFLRSQPVNASSTGTGSVLTYSGSVSGTGNLAVNGTGAGAQAGGGRVVLTGNNSAFAGTWQVGGGVLAVDGQNRLGSAPVVLDGGTLHVTADTTIANRILLTNLSTLRGGLNETVFTGRIETRSTGAGLTVAAQVTLENAATYDGPTFVDGVLSLRGTNGKLAGTSAITLRQGSTLDLDNRVTSAANRLPAVPLTLAGGHYRFQGGAGTAAESQTLGALTLSANTGNLITLRPQSETTSSVRQVFTGGLARGSGSTLVIESRNQQGLLGGVIQTGFAGSSTGAGEVAIISPAGPSAFGFVNGILPHAFLLQAHSTGANTFGEGRLVTAVPGLPAEGPNRYFVRHFIPGDSGVVFNTFAGTNAATNLVIDQGRDIGGGVIVHDYSVPTGLAVNAVEVRNANLKTSTSFTVASGTIAFGQGSNGISRESFLDPYGIVRSPAGVDLSVYTTNYLESNGTPFEFSFSTTFAPGSGVLNMVGGFADLSGMYPDITRLNIHSGRVRATGGDPGVPQFNANLDLHVQRSADFFIADNLLASPPDNNLPALNRLTGEGDVDFTGPTLTVGGAGGSSTFGGRLTASGGGTVVKAGTGTLRFNRGDAVPGPITVNGGILAFGTGTTTLTPALATVTGDTILLRNGTRLTVDGVTQFQRALDIAGAVSLDGLLGTATTFTAGVNLRTGSTLTATAPTGGALRFSGLVSGGGALALDGGTIVLAVNNFHTGGTTLDNGVMVGVASSLPFGTGSVTVAGTSFVLPVGASRVVSNPLTLAGNVTFGPASGAEPLSTGFGLTFIGGVTLAGTGNRTVAVTGTGNFTLQDVSGAAANGLTKSGGGVLTLSGTSDYAGPTAIAAGTLNVVGSKTGAGTVTVGNAATTAATGVLFGPGSVSGLVTVRATGVISPGTGVGTMTLPNGVTFESGGAYLWELAANTTGNPGQNWDVLDLGFSSANVLAGALFVPNFVGTATPPDASAFWQTLRTWPNVIDGASTLGTTFTIDNSAWAQFGSFSAINGAGGGVSLRWSPVPEPSCVMLVAGGAALAVRFAGLRRRKRRVPM